MQPLVDGDILRYEVGFASEAGWDKEGYPVFDYVAEMLDSRIANICAITNATMPPILYLTEGNNFRHQIAKTQPYKQRQGHKPWHFKNLTAYMKAKYETRATPGLEADDLMALEQCRREALIVRGATESEGGIPTIICTRDKDLYAVPGWHYGWELGNQPSFGPERVEELGYIKLSSNRKSIKGTGLLFFYAQCLTGDAVDTVPGLGRCGPVKAFNTLEGSETSTEAFKRVLEAYRGLHGDNAEEVLLEQGRLLWMTRELHEDGSPVLWDFPKDV
jgi:5'-3' exonuclease